MWSVEENIPLDVHEKVDRAFFGGLLVGAGVAFPISWGAYGLADASYLLAAAPIGIFFGFCLVQSRKKRRTLHEQGQLPLWWDGWSVAGGAGMILYHNATADRISPEHTRADFIQHFSLMLLLALPLPLWLLTRAPRRG